MAPFHQLRPLPQLLPAGARGFAVVDLETTGTGQLCRIVEIALLLLSLQGEIEQEWSTLINPGVPIPNAAVHGIDERLAAAAPSFSAVVPTLAALLEGRVLVAHNLDRGCLRGQSLSIGMDEHRSGLRQEEDAGDLLRIAAGEFGHHQAPVARLSEVPWQSLEAGVAAFEPGFALNREQPEQQQRPEIAQQS